MSSIFKAALAAIAMLGLTATAHADVITDTLYHITLCSSSGPGSPCYVQPVQAPIPSLSGLDEAIEAFYEPLLQDTDWKYGVKGANNLGYVYGQLRGEGPSCGGVCVTPFVYNQPQQEILCCNADEPYFIDGLNDNGVFIGRGGSGYPFASSDITHVWVEPTLPTLDAASIAFLESLGLRIDIFFYELPFDAIDNRNRIGGRFGTGSFLLTPVTTIPEPASLVLLISALMAGAGVLRARRVA